jgi:phthalate 4,5-cis-dihydrodiol dehydrogenase
VSRDPIRVGVLGLGRAFTLMLPTFLMDDRVRLVAAHDPRQQAMQAFERDFDAVAHPSPESLCADPKVEWVYVATPHQCHAEHVVLAARHGKHVLVEKPMALTLSDCDTMIAACQQAGTCMLVGHSHSFDAPVRLARQLIASRRYGEVRMVHALNFTDFLYRPRRPEELDTAQGGGVVFSQAAHQVDMVRLLVGQPALSVHARTGRWDHKRATEGAYTALVDFAGGSVANLTYNGYGFYDSDVWMDGLGELGQVKAVGAHQATRQRLAAAQDELAEVLQKAERNYAGRQFVMPDLRPPKAYQHFGPVIVSCDGADLRLTPYGVEVHDMGGVQLKSLPAPVAARTEVIDEWWSVAREGQRPVHDGVWARATLGVCLAILASAQDRVTINLNPNGHPLR